MSREVLSPEGLRMDGRRSDEIRSVPPRSPWDTRSDADWYSPLRRIKCELGQFTRSDGSALFMQGNTKVGR
jgi:ribonuclease PH